MTAPAILVLTTVHSPDDTRIRERLIRSLDGVGQVTYATKDPGPTDKSDLTWMRLGGGRLGRNLNAFRLLLGRDWDLAILHDPETIPAGVLAHLVRRSTVVFDVHEDLPAQIASKTWVPVWARPAFRALGRGLYWLAGRFLVLSLAEPGYRRLFKGDHPVFANYPRSSTFPDPRAIGDGSAVYVGDITRARGIEEALAASDRSGVALVAVGRVDDGLAQSLSARARALGVELTFTGLIPNPEAVTRMSMASVGLSPLRDEANYRDSLPTKTLEYLAMGVPVVATDLPGTRSVLGDLEAVWLVPPGDVAAMATAIEEAVRPEARTAAVEQATEVRDRFRWPEEDVRSFYTELINRRETQDPS
jgi:glycosyltransferase involved in cell wall biosynthesis